MRINLDQSVHLTLSDGTPAPGGPLIGEYDASPTRSGWWAVRKLDKDGKPIPEVIANIRIDGIVAT